MTSCVVALCQPWFYLRLKAYSFLWLSEGAYSLPRDSTVLEAHSPPNGIKDTHPRTKASEEPKSHDRNDPAKKILHQTLKLLVVSDILRRNELLSSKPTK